MFWPLLCSGQKPLKKVFNLPSRFRLISSCLGFMSESLCLIGRYCAEQRLELDCPRVRILSWSSGRKKSFIEQWTYFYLMEWRPSIWWWSWWDAIKINFPRFLTLSCLGRGAIKLLHLSGVNRGRNKRIRFQAIAPQCRRLYCVYCVKGILRASV